MNIEPSDIKLIGSDFFKLDYSDKTFNSALIMEAEVKGERMFALTWTTNAHLLTPGQVTQMAQGFSGVWRDHRPSWQHVLLDCFKTRTPGAA